MQKHLSSLFTAITIAIFAFCLAMPTLGHETPEERRRDDAKETLDSARFDYTNASKS